MARRKKFPKGQGFVAMPWELLNSLAWKELTHPARGLLPHILGQVKKHPMDPARYETDFCFRYAEAKRFGYHQKTFHAIIEQLIDKGFLVLIRRGSLKNIMDGDGGPAIFRLSMRWNKDSTK
jgi:hypothetical protein